MVKLVCVKCGKEFSRKDRYDSHVLRVRSCTDNPRSEVAPPSSLPLDGLNFIDLFCGIGGFHCALSSLGATCVLACDIDENCRKVYKNNWGLEPLSDVKTIKPEDIPPFDILCAGFPCQAFSHAGNQGGFEDTRGTLFQEICKILKHCKPAFFLLENVKNLKGHDGGKTIAVIYKSLREVGYTMHDEPTLLSPHHLGVPQHRERLFICGVRSDLTAEPLNHFPAITVQKTDISSILEPESVEYPELKLTKNIIELLDFWEVFIKHFKKTGVKLPTIPLWTEFWGPSDIMKKEIKKMPDWKQEFIRKNNVFYEEHKIFLQPWLLSARNHKDFYGAKSKFEWQCGSFKENDSLWTLLFTFRPSGIRVKRSNYSPTLVDMAQIINVGARKRKLSPREVARLQSYPDTFKMPASSAVAYKQFGNSVNVKVIERMAKFLVTEMLA